MTGRILLTLLLVCGIGCTKKNDIVSVSKKVEAPVVAKIYLNLKEGQGEPTFTYERVSRFKSSKGRDNTKKRRRDGYNEIEPIPVNTSVDVVMYSGAFSYNPRFDIAGDPGFSIVSSTCDGATAPCETVIRFSPTTVGTYWTDFLLSIGSAVIHHEFDAWAYDQVEEPDCPRCEYGSILKIDSKGMIETVPVVGSDFLLNYTSNFMPEYYSNYTNVGRQASFNPEGMSLSHVHFLNVAEGRLFLGNGFTSQITSLTSGSDILVPYGDEVFVFNSSGVHTSTRSFLTGFTKYTFHYDANGKLELIEDAFGKETELLRDGSGNLEMIIGPYGDETEIMVNGDGLIETITNPKNETHELYYYIGTSMIESVIYPTGREKFYEYTEAGELRYYERPDGKNIQWFPWLAATEETEIGQLSPTGREDITHVHRDKITNLFTRNTVTPEGFAETYTEGADKSQSIVNGFVAFNKTTQNDPRFGSSKKIDDTLTEVIDGLTRTTVYNDVVSGSGLFSYATLTRESSVNSKTTTSVFNRSTRVETITDPSSVVTTISYNTKEQPVSTNLGSETAVTMTYDGYGRLSQSYQGAKGSNTFTYNAGGLLQKVTNALSQETTYTYDLAGRLKTTTFPDSRVITYWYNDDGMMTGVTPPGRSIHSFGLDLNQNMTSYTPPLLSGMSRSNSVYTYNDEKELTSIERPDLKTIEYNYNATNGLLESVDHDSGSATYAYITDSPILEEAVSIDGVTSEYVPFGTSGIKSEKITKGSHATEVIFARDNFFRTTQRTIKHNSSTKGTVSYAYRDNGQESSVGDLSFGYNSNGRRDEAIIGNLKETWMYDSFGQVSGYLVQYTGAGLPYATVYDICFTRDNMHRILSKIETIGGVSKTYEYTYDTAGRLKTTTVDLTDVYEFFYDSNSNITNVELNSVSVRTATIDGQDRLTATLGNTYVYNLTGELTSKSDSLTTTTYERDSFGNLKYVELPSTTEIEYILDWKGRRVERHVSGVLNKRYAYESDLKMSSEIDISTGNFREFIYSKASTSPEYMKDGSTKYRFVKDNLGSVRLVVDVVTGVVAQRIDYNEWGKVLTDTNPGYQPFGFAGGLYDHQTGLVRFGARDYDGEVGRWQSKDPILFEGGDSNLFGYVQNDPINWIDPRGTDKVDDYLSRSKDRVNEAKDKIKNNPRDIGAIKDCVLGIIQDAGDTIQDIIKNGNE